MSKKKKNSNIDDVLEKIYYFLKNKLSFDDVQAISAIVSIILLPIAILFGFFYIKNQIFKNLFFIVAGWDLLGIIYSIVKYKYFENKRINFIKDFKDKIITITNISEVDKLNSLEFEYFVKEIFVKKGYRAKVTKMTHDNRADVIADKGNEKIAIQIKHSSKPIAKNAVYDADCGKDSYKADRAILITNNELTNQTKIIAGRYKIEIIDGHDISAILRKGGPIRFTYEE